MLERLIFVAAVTLIAAVLWVVYQRWWVRRLAAASPTDPLLNAAPRGVPVIVYFTTPTCAPCRTQQQPALAVLKQSTGERVHIIQVDATAQPADADRWGVFGAPTTFVLDAAHRVRHINRAVASAEQLQAQLAG